MGERNGTVVAKQALSLPQQGCWANQICCEVVGTDSTLVDHTRKGKPAIGGVPVTEQKQSKCFFYRLFDRMPLPNTEFNRMPL